MVYEKLAAANSSKGHIFPGSIQKSDVTSPKGLDCRFRNLLTLSAVNTGDLRYSGKRRYGE